jgi:hypothetical protein
MLVLLVILRVDHRNPVRFVDTQGRKVGDHKVTSQQRVIQFGFAYVPDGPRYAVLSHRAGGLECHTVPILVRHQTADRSVDDPAGG